MKISSIILLLLYCVLMFATLFVKNEKLKLTKLLAVLGIIIAIVHTVLFLVAQSHWAILLTSLVLFMSYGIANGFILKKNTYIALGNTINCVCCYICNLATLFADLDTI